jgi:putative membrane protein
MLTSDNKKYMQILLRVILNTIAVFVAAALIPGVHLTSIFVAVLAAITLGILNAFVRPALVLLTLPVTVVTLGLFVFVINALLVMFAAYIVPGFTVDGFWWALLFVFVLSIVSSFLNSLARR